MEEGYDSEKDFVLPPLPIKPQKTLLSFFQGKATNVKQKKAKVPMNNLTERNKNCDVDKDSHSSEQSYDDSPLKPLRRKRRRRRLENSDSNEECDKSEVQQSRSEVDSINVSKENIREIESNEHTQAEIKSAVSVPAKIEVVKCDIPTPFPAVNHIKQNDSEHCFDLQFSEKSKKFHIFEVLNELNDMEVSENSWRSLLNLKSTNESDCVPEELPGKMTLEECLKQIENEHKNVSVRKIFQQYLECQKKVIMSDLQRIQSSKLAVQAIWQKDSEIQTAVQLNNQMKETEQQKRKEGKDIRKMFTTNSKKKNKVGSSTPAVHENEDTDKQDQQNVANERNIRRRAKEKSSDTDVKHVEKEKVSIKVSGLFGKALDRKHRGKRKNENESAKENIEKAKSLNGTVNNKELQLSHEESVSKEESSPQSSGKDIRMLFHQNNNSDKTADEKMIDDIDSTYNGKNTELEGENQENVVADGDSMMADLYSTQAVECNEIKKKKKKKKTSDFLKIKLLPLNSTDDESMDYNNIPENKPLIPKTNIKSLFAKIQKKNSKEEFTPETDGHLSSTQCMMNNVENLHRNVERDEDTLLNDSGKEENKKTSACDEEPSNIDNNDSTSMDGHSNDSTTKSDRLNALRMNRNANSDIRSFFGNNHSHVKEENKMKTSKSPQCTANEEAKELPSIHLKNESTPVSKMINMKTEVSEEVTASVSMETDDKSNEELKSSPSVNKDVNYEISGQVTPCKVEIKNIASPGGIIAQEIPPIFPGQDSAKPSDQLVSLSDNEKDVENNIIVSKNNVEKCAKRKRRSSQRESNKKLKQNETDVPTKTKRSLRNQDEPSKHVKDSVRVENRSDVLKTEDQCKTDIDENVKNTVTEKVNAARQCDEGKPSLRRSSRSKKRINYNEHILTEHVPTNTKEIETNVKKETTKRENKESDEMMEKGWEEIIVPSFIDQSVVCLDDDLSNNKSTDENPVSLMAPLTPKKIRPVIEVILNEATINSFLCWTEKYQPMKARYVMGEKNTVKELFNWLCSWKERHELIVKKMAARAAKKPSKARSDSESESESDDSSSEEEGLLTNTLLLSGPSGCGTTAAVYACAKQMDFKVLELNPNMYRTGKRVYDLVSEAVVSHQVRKGIKSKHVHSPSKGGRDMISFFNSDKTQKRESKDMGSMKDTKDLTQDAMSLVLFEQSDIVYEDYDRGFWQGVADLRILAKRPIILTANDDKILPFIDTEENMPVEHISMTHPTTEQILPMMQIACLVEQVFVPSYLLKSIIERSHNDVRQILMQLQFWFDQGKDPLFTKFKNNNKHLTSSDEKFDNREIPSLFRDKQSKDCEKCNNQKRVKSGLPNDSSVGTTILRNKLYNKNGESESPHLRESGTIIETADNGANENADDNHVKAASEENIKNHSHSKTFKPINNTIQNETLQCINDIEISESQSIVDNTSQDREKEEIYITETVLRCFPVHVEENMFDLRKLIENPNRRTGNCSYFSFTKQTATTPSDANQNLSCITDRADQLSEVDSYLMPGCTYLDKDVFKRSRFVDSLSESFISVNARKHFPNVLCSSVQGAVKSCYEYSTDQIFDSCSYHSHHKFQTHYDLITRRLSMSAYFGRNARSQEIIPCLENICRFEDIRKNTQQRRRQRRFLHYLDSNGMCFDEETISQLTESSFDTF